MHDRLSVKMVRSSSLLTSLQARAMAVNSGRAIDSYAERRDSVFLDSVHGSHGAIFAQGSIGSYDDAFVSIGCTSRT